MSIVDAISRRFPGDTPQAERLRTRAIESCTQMIDEGLLDGTAAGRLCSQDDDLFWPIFSEVLIADQLIKAGLRPLHLEPGPDFLIEIAGRRHWVEVITPKATGVPDDWIKHELGSGGVFNYPAEAILLRWTAAIKEKAEKLLGVPDVPGKRGYLASGIVGPDDIYIIAVNGLRLRMGAETGLSVPQLEGISQMPVAIEATYAVGPYAITVDRNTFEQTGGGHQHRRLLMRDNRAAVPADTFHDRRFDPISAIWALDLGISGLVENEQPMAVIHNPNAINPLTRSVLPAQKEYWVSQSADGFEVHVENGRGRPQIAAC